MSQKIAPENLGGRSSFASSAASSRQLKAMKVFAIMQEQINLRDAVVLDVGTGSGQMAALWAEHCQTLHSVDVCDQRVTDAGYHFSLIENEVLPFVDGAFDAVISNQVVEHVWDQEMHIREIARVLKPNGVAYLSTPNRFCLMEPHHRLPLLAWFGDRVAITYLKLFRGKDWDVKLLSYRKLYKMLSSYFKIVDAVPQVMSRPLHFHQTRNERLARWLSRVPSILWQSRINVCLPSFMIILKKHRCGKTCSANVNNQS